MALLDTIKTALFPPKKPLQGVRQPMNKQLNDALFGYFTQQKKMLEGYAKILEENRTTSQRVKLLQVTDASDWVAAVNRAVHPDQPNRLGLYRLYWQAITSMGHLRSALSNRKKPTLSQPFRWVGADGVEDRALTAQFQRPWFRQFMEHALDSEFYGYSLVELLDRQDPEKVRCSLVPRAHVVPEAGLIVQTPGIMQGWDFTASANLIGIGQIDSLGLLDSVALLYIHWKNTLISWTLYAEKFGMPMLSVETNTVDTERLDQIQDMLDNFGEDLSAIMQPGEKFTIVESGRADAYKVYQELLKMLQADVSKSILGQTMTMENGSSRAQAAVHYQVQLGVINADRRLVTDAINQQLKAALPWVPQEMTFEFRNREVMTMPERAALMESLHKVGARFEAGYLQEEFGVEIAGMATETSPNNGE
jgi:hypothetical protein